MDATLKQRLVGAVVLVALAVIFLPMLLDGSGARERLNEDISIPDQPAAPESRLEQDNPDTAHDGSGESATSSATLATDDFGNGDAEAGDDADAQATASTETADAPAPEEDAGTADAPTPEEDAGAVDAGDGAGTVTGGDIEEGWVVQVGSFQRETNALVLRDRLRENGFDAHAEQVTGDSGTLWRVRLGPVADREQGEALKKRIEDHRGGDALLMTYPR